MKSIKGGEKKLEHPELRPVQPLHPPPLPRPEPEPMPVKAKTAPGETEEMRHFLYQLYFQ